MFESNEAVRGRLIGPKPWDRIDRNFSNQNVEPVTVRTVWVFHFTKFVINHVLIGMRPEMAVKCGFTR